MIKYPTAHKDKLIAAINNSKLPESEIQPLKKAYTQYKKWIMEIEKIYSIEKKSSDQKICLLVKELNKYKNYGLREKSGPKLRCIFRHFLKLQRAFIAQSGMEAVSIIPTFNPLKNLFLCCIHTGVYLVP